MNSDSMTHGAPESDTPEPEEFLGPDHFTRADIDHLCECLGSIADSLAFIVESAAVQAEPTLADATPPPRRTVPR